LLQGFWEHARFDQLTLADIVQGEPGKAALR
jgi:hypothetical protein